MDQDRAAPNLPPADPRSVRIRLDALRQKSLFRIATAYAVAAWLVIQVAATVAPAFDFSPWWVRAVILLAVLGFIATVGYFGFVRSADGETANQLKRRNRFANRATFVALLVAALAGGGYVARQTLFAHEPVSLAVLPFADLSPGRDKAYFAEGIGEQILSALGTEESFKVLGRTSARQLERDPNPADVRRKLGVTHLLEGSARTSGDELRVNVRLIDTGDGSQVWEEEYNGQLADVFAVQDKIAGAVVKRLRGTLINSAGRSAVERPSLDSYETYLAARALIRERSKKTLGEALVLARGLIAADPGYAPGHALFAELTYMSSNKPNAYGDMPYDQARRLALPHAREAIRLAPDKSEGYAALGFVELPLEGVAPLKRAITLDPARAELRIWLGLKLTELGRNDEAFEQYREAASIEPLWPVAINRLAQGLVASGQDDAAAAAVRLYRRRGGSVAQTFRFTALLARARGDFSASTAAERAGLARDPNLPYVADWLVREYHLLGLREEALAMGQGRLGGQYRRLWLSGDREGLRTLVRNAPAAAVESGEALFTLGALRDWPIIARLHSLRPPTVGDLCYYHNLLVPQTIMALRETGNIAEGQRLTKCARARVERELAMTMRSPEDDPGGLEMRKASLLALTGDRSAIGWLDRAITRGWLGQYYSGRLSDWPQFDALRGDPQLAKLQRRIDAKVAREKAETLRDLGAGRL